jgi:hypothetical protein
VIYSVEMGLLGLIELQVQYYSRYGTLCYNRENQCPFHRLGDLPAGAAFGALSIAKISYKVTGEKKRLT